MVDNNVQNEFEETISKQELDSILAARNKLLLIELNKRNAELELQNLILQTYVRYNLSEKDSIEETTGKIKRIS